MKRLFSKRSGFTLVEIIIAFAIFAIMASMIVQVLNLMVQRKVRNKKFEDNLSVQEEQFIARTKDMSYNSAADADGQLKFQFKDNGGGDIPVDDIDYQLKNWDPDNAKNGINYFAGDYEYVLDTEGSNRYGDEDPDSEDDDPMSVGGSTQMSRFDTRLTGTKGIKSIRIDITKSPTEACKYTVTVTVVDEDSPADDAINIDDAIKSHSQVSLFFAENKPNGKAIKVVSVNDNSKDGNLLKKVKKCGDNGVNVHCEDGSSGFGNSSVTFTLELAEDVAASDLRFGENASGNIYTPFTYTYKDKDGNNKTETYVNIFGAYQKSGSSTPAEGEPDGDPEE